MTTCIFQFFSESSIKFKNGLTSFRFSVDRLQRWVFQVETDEASVDILGITFVIVKIQSGKNEITKLDQKLVTEKRMRMSQTRAGLSVSLA